MSINYRLKLLNIISQIDSKENAEKQFSGEANGQKNLMPDFQIFFNVNLFESWSLITFCMPLDPKNMLIYQ